ncbi:MAG: hypothetical protein RR732_01560, partial [Bacilli bacterium]
MNKGYKKIILIEVGMILVLFFNAFILDLIMVNNKMIFIQNIYTICFWLTVILCLFVLVGLEKNKFLKQMDVLESIFIYSLTFLIITYLSGIFFGYIRSPYNLTIIGIIKNIVPLIIIIILAELSRFYIIVKCN